MWCRPPFFLSKQLFFSEILWKTFLAPFFPPGAFKIALNCPSRNLYWQKNSWGRTPDPHLQHGEPSGPPPHVLRYGMLHFWGLSCPIHLFWGTFSQPPTPKRSFWVPILPELDVFGPNFHFCLNLLGSNFQWPVAHPHQFSDPSFPPPSPPPGFHVTDIDHKEHLWVCQHVSMA